MGRGGCGSRFESRGLLVMVQEGRGGYEDNPDSPHSTLIVDVYHIHIMFSV